MSLQTEPPSSKAKREQALRSILAARRRQIYNHRIESRNPNRTPRPGESSLKEDMLEAQETSHGMYVTASASAKPSEPRTEDPSESSSRIIVADPESKDVDIEFASKEVEGEQVAEQPRKPSNESFTASSSEGKLAPGNSRSNYPISHRNSSSTPSTPTSSSLLASSQKASDTESRKKNIVSMPESLYNYFRPVESNIPVEDMSQFLYFGQKIQAEPPNSTGNNVEATPTAPTSPNSRRRYSMKRFSTTTVPVPKLEEIINEEMNIAVERQVVEKNKVSKIKNAFRSPESGVYYRKSRLGDATIASNVIMETGRNVTGFVTGKPGTALIADKVPEDNPSAHADRDQLRLGRGSVAAHVLAETRNATNSTQIHGQPVSADTDKAESETGFKDPSTEASETVGSLNALKTRRKPDNSTEVVGNVDVPEVGDTSKDSKSLKNLKNLKDSKDLEDLVEPSASTIDTEVYGEHTEQRIRRIDIYDAGENLDLKTDQTQGDHPRVPISKESNNIETSTSRDKPSRSTEPFRIWTSAETSTLRIIVTEDSLESFALGTDAAEKYTVKPVDSAEERVPSKASGDVPSSTPSTEPIWTSSTSAGSVVDPRSKGHREQKQQRHQPEDKGPGGDREQNRHQEQQQHVYAYTITNVTRLLRNYTGPGLSREEEGASERSTTEITTGSAQRRQPPPPSLLQLPRAGSGIEAARAPAELSAGTTVEPVAAGGASTVLVGERLRKVVTVAAQTEERASRASQLTVNKSGPRSAKQAEVEARTSRGAVRWNHTKARSSDLEGFGDRRLLRKSASAVLNQRIGAGDEEGSVGKRRRTNATNVGKVTNGSGLSGRRVTGGKSVEGFQGAVNGSRVEKKTRKEKNLENEAPGSLLIGAVKDIERNMTGVGMEASTEPTTQVSAEEDGSNLTEMTGGNGTDTKDGSTVSRSEKESVATSGSSENKGSDSGAGRVANASDGSGSSTVTVTASETIESAETSATAMPVFPVTPRIIAETVRSEETFTLNPTEPASQAADAKTESNRASANLNPSEIQKMYRSKDATSTAEAPTTSVTPVQIEISTIPHEQSEGRVQDGPDSSNASAVVEPRKRVSGERSPEVRARNLSDKSKDKDDVLPIMHLYNTSDIFNNSGAMNSFSKGTERRIPLPVDARPGASGAAEKANDRVTPRTPANETTHRAPVSEHAKKDRHDEARESPSQVPPTGPGRGSNRTRHRPIFNPSILPEYNVSVYPNELNRTFFDTGLISVSPRESVNISEVISKRHDGDAIATQETVAVVSYILATLVVFPIAVGVGLILRRLILRNRKVSEFGSELLDPGTVRIC